MEIEHNKTGDHPFKVMTAEKSSMRSEDWQRYRDRLYRYIVRMVGRSEAEDLLQEVMLRAHRAEGAAAVTTAWMFTVANHLCIDHLRKSKPRSMADVPEPPVDGATEGAEQDELKQAVWRAIAELPVDQRQVFLLREESGLTFREIAQMLDIPLNTALGRMHYALDKLRKSLAVYRESKS